MPLNLGTRRSLLGSATRYWAVQFNATNTVINHGSDAAIDDLHDNAFTVEMWRQWSGSTWSHLIAKGIFATHGWEIRVRDPSLAPNAFVFCATTHAESWAAAQYLGDKAWHHIVMFYDDAGDRKIYLAMDGQWASSYSAQTAGVGAIQTDAANSLLVGKIIWASPGMMGWYRISNNDRYNHGVNFTPPPRGQPPESDANTILLCPLNEGTGTTIDNAEGTAALDGTLSNGTWIKT